MRRDDENTTKIQRLAHVVCLLGLAEKDVSLSRGNYFVVIKYFPQRCLLSRNILVEKIMIALRRPRFFVKAYTCFT